jgi:hypothetical protein
MAGKLGADVEYSNFQKDRKEVSFFFQFPSKRDQHVIHIMFDFLLLATRVTCANAANFAATQLMQCS